MPSPNPTVSSIVFSPAQFQLRKDKNLSKGNLNEFEVDDKSPDMTYNESFVLDDEEEPKELRKMLVELNYQEADAEKVLVKAIETLSEMEEQQKRACNKISEFLEYSF